MAATAAAPLSSAATPVSRHSHRAAAAISWFSTSTMRSTACVTIARLRLSLRRGAKVTAAVSRPASELDEAAGRQARVQCRCAGWFDPDDANGGLQRLGGDRDAGNQTAAANGDEQRVEIGRVVENLERNCALPGNHVRIGEEVYVDEAFVRGKLQRRPVAVVPVL